MPEKNTALWFALWDTLPEPVRAAIVGGAVAFLRVMYDDKEPRVVRRLLESILCGAIAYGIATAIEALGMQPGIATFCGGAVGLLGADWVRAKARLVADRRIDRSAP